MLDLSKEMLDNQVIIPDKYLIEELRDFSEDGAEEKGHDDRVMAMMIALYCGHEGEFEDIRHKPSAAQKDQNNYIVYKMEVDLGLECKFPWNYIGQILRSRLRNFRRERSAPTSSTNTERWRI